MSAKECVVCGRAARYLRPETGYTCKGRRAALHNQEKERQAESRLLTQKSCPRCERVLTADEFGLRRRKNRSGSVSVVLAAWCIECSREYDRDRMRLVPKEIKAERVRSRRARDPRSRLVDRWYSARGRGSGVSLEEYAEWYERLKMGCGPGDWQPWMLGSRDDQQEESEYQKLRTLANDQNQPVQLPNGSRIWPTGWNDARRWRWRYRNDPTFMLWQRQMSQFKHWLKGKKRTNSLARVVDYSREELVSHIERQFTKGMSWANYGEWHIDHIMPKNLFDPRDREDTVRCWSLSNLRPLWAQANCSRPRDGSDALL